MAREEPKNLVMIGNPIAAPRVVFLSAHLPSANSKQAGQRVAYDHLQQLAQTFPVDLVAFANAAERLDMDGSLNALCRHITIVPVTTWTRIRGAISRPDLPTYVALRASRRVSSMLVRLCEESSNVVLWAEYTQMAQYLRSLEGLVRRTVLVCQDVLGQLCERYARLKGWPLAHLTRLECLRLARWEAAAVKYASVTVTMSEKDRVLLRQLGADNVIVAFPRAQFVPAGRAECATGSEPTMMFFGAMDRNENHEAVLWFLDMVLPAIRSAIPNARVLIVGAHPRRALLARCQESEGVEVTGYVPDPRRWFAQAWLGIVPLQSGAGLKIKVVEFLAQGLPVVTTEIGSEGIAAQGGDGVIVCNAADEFARHCITLLTDREACRSLGQAARRWFSTSYRPHEFGPDDVRKLVLGYT